MVSAIRAISIQAYNYIFMIATATFDIRMSFLDNSGTKSHMAERVPEIEHCSSVYSKQYIKVLLQRIFRPLFYWLNLKCSLS